MDCKFLISPMAGDISPPRFKFDRFLEQYYRNLRTKLIQFTEEQKIKREMLDCTLSSYSYPTFAYLDQ
jgi:hypothetical protein